MILDAKAAFKLTEDINSAVNKATLQNIEGQIKQSAKAGMYSVNIDKYISDTIAYKLQELGYHLVRYSDQREGSYTSISWAHYANG
jgi:hypothetical protein